MAQKKKIIALDIGSHSVKVAVASVSRESAKTTSFESFRLPAGNPDTLEAIRPWMEKHGYTNSRAVIALAGKDVIFQPFQMVPADPRTAEQAAAMEVLKFNEMASENMIYDFSEFSLAKEDNRLLLAIARPSLLDAPLAMAAARKLQVEDIIPSPIAVFNAMDGFGKDKQCTIYVHAGHSSTSISIGIGDQLLFARAFSCGGGIFTSALAESMDIPLAQAENAKHASGSLEPGTKHAETLTSAADRWFAELNSCIAVFKSLFPSDKSQIQNAVLSGGGAKLEGLPQYLESKLNIPVEVPDPDDTDPSKAFLPEYAVCCGLVKSMVQNSRAAISLMPEHIREDIISRRQRSFWYASAATAALALGISLAGGYIQLKRTQGVLNQRMADRATRRDIASKIESVRMKNESLRAMAAPLSGLLNSTPIMTSVLKTVAENRGAEEWITLVCDADSYFNPEIYFQSDDRQALRARTSRRKKEESTTKAGISSVIIEGFTRNTSLSTVSSLITELKKLEFVASADLLSDDMLAPLPDDNLERRLNAIRFAIEVKVKQE